jgi:hypothetical protein
MCGYLKPVLDLLKTFMGPYTVTKVHKADVLIKHLATEDSKEVHMEHLKPFFSDSYGEAYKAALVDLILTSLWSTKYFNGRGTLRLGLG